MAKIQNEIEEAMVTNPNMSAHEISACLKFSMDSAIGVKLTVSTPKVPVEDKEIVPVMAELLVGMYACLSLKR